MPSASWVSKPRRGAPEDQTDHKRQHDQAEAYHTNDHHPLGRYGWFV